jgi:hypothetical protein
MIVQRMSEAARILIEGLTTHSSLLVCVRIDLRSAVEMRHERVIRVHLWGDRRIMVHLHLVSITV